jgi:hypothetical protein
VETSELLNFGRQAPPVTAYQRGSYSERPPTWRPLLADTG